MAGAAILLLATIVVWRIHTPRRPASAPNAVVSTPAAAPSASIAPTKTLSSPAPKVAASVVNAPASSKDRGATPAIAAFDDWAERFIKADAAGRNALLNNAESLANARREEMTKLIRENPEQAIAQALPYGIRKQLPESVLGLIEQPFSTRGTVRPHVNYLAAEEAPMDCRVDGFEVEVRKDTKKKVYRAYIAEGYRAHAPHQNVPVSGVRIGNVVALRREPTRRVRDKAEIADLAAAGKLTSKCQSCGQNVTPENGSVLEFGEQYYTYCQESEADQFNTMLAQAYSLTEQVGAAGLVAGNPPDQLPPPGTSQTQGIKKLLYIRVTFADNPQIPQTDDAAMATAAANNQFFNTGSYNTVWWETTVTPVIRLPQSKVNYGETSDIVGDAIAGAAALGYFASDYFMTYVLTTTIPQFKFGGLSSGILNNSPGAVSHELGHNFGLPHANFYQPEGRNPGPTNNTPFPKDPDSILIGHSDINAPTGPGGAPKSLGDPNAEAVYEYGDPYDTMGGGGPFNAMFRYQMHWLPRSAVAVDLKSATNRIYAFDVPRIEKDRTYAVLAYKSVADDVEFWLSYRQGVANNPWFASGIEIMMNVGTVLIDTTPDSAYGRQDAALVVGRTFHDPQANLHITPIAISDSPDPTNKWIDVVVQIGDFPDNHAPTLSISSDALTITNGGTVTFNSVAQDSDGDQLAYYWDFGDHTFGTNGPTQSKTFTTDGNYVVRCEVSDMKGGVASRFLVVTVGEPTTHTISGRVVDPNGFGVQGVRVHNSRARPDDTDTYPIDLGLYRYGYTDSDGYYAIGNVPSGTYTNRAFIYGYQTVPQNFTDPLVVSDGDTTDFDFIATPITRVKIAQTTDAKEPGEDGVTEDETGHFIITRDGDTSGDLAVRFETFGAITAENLTSDTATIILDQHTFVIPAGFSSVDLRYTPTDNSVGTGNETVGIRLLLATNDVQITTVLTNVLTTNNGVIITNTEFVTRTNNLSIPGWVLRPSGPNQALTWFQTDPTYVIDHAEAFIQVIDDDPPAVPQVAVAVLDGDVMESSSDTSGIVFFRSGAPITNDLTIPYTTSGVASNGVDYTGLSGTVTIPAGESFAIVYVTAVNDLLVEGNEQASVEILPDPQDRYTVTGGSASFLIIDDDLPLVNAFPAIARATRGGSNGRITFSRAGTLSEDLTINYLVTGTAVAGSDYTPLAGSITIPAGQLSVNLPISAIASSTNPLPRTVTVQISDSTTYNIYSDNAATVTIIDGNLPTVTITGGGDVGESGGTTSFTVSRTGPTTNSLTVFFEVGGTAWEGIDYSAIGTNVVIPAGASSANITLNTINDSARELGRVIGEETVVIQLRDGTNYLLGGSTSRSIRINDDEGDTALPAVGFLLSTSTVREDAGAALIYVRVTANPATNKPVEIDYRISGGTAIPNVNYTPGTFERGATGVLHFVHVEAPDPPSIISDSEGSVAAIQIPILNDGVSTSPNKTITLTLMNPGGFVTNVSFVTNNNQVFSNTVITRVPTNAFLGPSVSHTLTILDVGTSLVSITAATNLAYELGSQPVKFTLTRSGATNVPLTVSFTVNGTAANGNDFILSTNATITIPAGTNSAVLTLIPRDDPTEETAEYMTVNLLAKPGYGLGSPSSATVLLVSDDGTIQFLESDYRVAENAGPASIPVVRSGNTNIAVSVSFVISNRTAIAGEDYVMTNGTITFAPGETLKNFEVPLINDSVVEPDETIAMSLVNPSGGVPLGGQKTATLTIVNDDTDFSFSQLTFRGNENAAFGTVEIVRSGVLSATQSVAFIATNGTADSNDFVATNIVVEFVPGQTNALVTVDLLDDNLFEGDETIALSLANPTDGAAIGSVSNATLVIVDDECRLDFEASRFFVHEYSNAAPVVIRRIGGTVNPVSITYTTADLTASNGLDYLGGTFTVEFTGDHFEADTNGSGQLTFVPGESVKTVMIPILDDAEGEGNEDFTITLGNPQVLAIAATDSAVLGSNTTTTVTIIDNETPGNVDYEFVSSPNGPVRAAALQYDGKIVIGGEFTLIDGFSFIRIARLQANGVFDAGFNPGAGANNTVFSVASAPDGKVYLGGDFTQVNNTNRTRIARLAADGKLDMTFSNSVNGIVRAIALQTNGQAVIAGDFTTVGNTARSHIARLNGDGSLDTVFNPNINGNVFALAIQPNGKIVVGGNFSLVNGASCGSIVRLNDDGSVDVTLATGTGINGTVNSLAIQTDEKILAGGSFTSFNGVPRNNLVRMFAGGVLDANFTTGAGPNSIVNTIALAPNGKIFIGGDFASYNGVLVNRIARLKSDGTLDFVFIAGAGANGTVRTSIAQSDTAIIIGGDFTEVNGVARNYVARLHGDEKSNIASVELAAGASVQEDAGVGAITLLRSGNTNVAFTLNWGTYDITATNGLDYTGDTNTVSFAAGQTSAVINVTILNDPILEGDETFGLFVSGAPPSVDLSGITNVPVTILDDEKAIQFASANYLVNEGATNAVITLTRIGGQAGSISATFVTSDGTAQAGNDYNSVSVPVTFASGQVTTNVLVPIIDDFAGEPAETIFMRLLGPIGGELGSVSNATLTIVDNDFRFGTITLSNNAAITIFDAQPASTYPSTISVANMTGVVSRVQVKFLGLRHSYPGDIDAMLVGPNGQSVMLMSDAGAGFAVTNLTLTFDDTAATQLPSNSVITIATNRPTDYGPADTFFNPAPTGPYGNQLSAFVGSNPNGLWSLYIVDDRGGDAGVISNGWQLILTTVDLNTVADLSVQGSMSPPSAASGDVVVYSFVVSNAGPNAATSVVLSNPFPAGLTALSAFASQGNGCVINSDSVVCDLDFLPVGGLASVDIKAIHALGGNTTNIAIVSASEPDVSVSNNVARVGSVITPGTTADLLVTITDSPDPVLQGENITYTVTVSNRGPLTATGIVLTDVLPENGNLVTASSSQGTFSNTGPSLVFHIGTLPFGATATATVLVQPRSGTSLTNSATATANEPDITENFASEVTSVSPAANVVLSMSDSQDPVGVNQAFGYNVVVYNAGPGIASNVVVFDILPAQFQFVSASGSQGSNYVSGGAVVFEMGTIPFGSSATATIIAKATTAGNYTNFATVIASQQDPDVANNSATEGTQVFQIINTSTNGGIQITRSTNAQQLASLVTGGGATGIKVTGARLLAHQLGENGPASSGIYTLSTVPSTYGLRSPGIVLSTGDVLNYESGTNSFGSQTTAFGQRATTAQEALLDPITGGGTNNFTHNDVTQLDIDFDMLPGFSRVQFKVVFGSEEYPIFVGSDFIDGFGIYLNGTNIAFANGRPVNINHPDFKPIAGTELNGVLAPGGNPVVQFEASVPAGSSNNTLTFIVADTTDTSLDTTVYVTSLEGGLAPNADLGITAIATPDPVPVGSNFTYRISVTNFGPDTVTNAVVTDVLPAGLTFNSAATSQGNFTVSNGVVTFNLGTMFRLIGATMSIDVTPQAARHYTNLISVASELADLRGANNAAVVVNTVTDPGAFEVPASITLGDAGPALTYPSVLHVSGFNGVIGALSVTLNNLSHTFPADLDILLVGPQGQNVILMSDCGAGNDISDVTLRFDDNAPDSLPATAPIVSGVFKPTNIGGGDVFFAPAPAGTYGSTLSAFTGTDPNGDWLLYIMDDQGSDVGVLFGGWRLNFSGGASVRLIVTRVGNDVVLSWPASATDYTLQSAPSVEGPWDPVQGAPATVNGFYVMTVQTTSAKQFFRLVHP
jgi:uncharacterized repeat protein (TIGR01451 family)/uncharacterized delta-60 repeat protein